MLRTQSSWIGCNCLHVIMWAPSGVWSESTGPGERRRGRWVAQGSVLGPSARLFMSHAGLGVSGVLLVRPCGHVGLRFQLLGLSSPTPVLKPWEGAVTVCPDQGHSSVCSHTLGWRVSHAHGLQPVPCVLCVFLSTSRNVEGVLESGTGLCFHLVICIKS